MYYSLSLGGAGFLPALASWIRTIVGEYRHVETRISPAFFAFRRPNQYAKFNCPSGGQHMADGAQYGRS
jgi:hypothetical protein